MGCPMRYLAVILGAAAMTAGRAGGQDRLPAGPAAPPTSPAASAPPVLATAAAPDFGQTVDRLCTALGESDAELLLSLLAEGARLRTFEPRATDAARLLARTRRGELLFARHYAQAPATFASDLSEAVRSAANVPEEVKRRMALRDERHARHANATAQQWLVAQCDGQASGRLAVLVFWVERPAPESAPPPASGGQAVGGTAELVFLVVRPEEGPPPVGRAPRIAHITFGDPARPGR